MRCTCHVLVNGQVFQQIVLLRDVRRLFPECFEIPFDTINLDSTFNSSRPTKNGVQLITKYVAVKACWLFGLL